MTSKTILLSAVALISLAGAAVAGADPAAMSVLQADRKAVGDSASPSMAMDFTFVGMGLTGKVVSVTDLTSGRFVDVMSAGSLGQTEGFDGAVAWSKEPSGTVSIQNGGDQRVLTVNEAYRRANLWWRADVGGATITSLGSKTDNGGATYDVVAVTPVGGKLFEAWFSSADHLLSRVVETQGPKSVTTTFSDYKMTDGVKLAGKMVIDTGDGDKYLQTMTLVSARFQAEPEASVFAPPKVELTDSSIGGGAAETTFPFTLINNHIYAKAMVNGQGPFTFIFDTGGLNLVTPTLAKTLGLSTKGSMAGGGAGEGSVEVGFTKVARLDVGGATLKDQAFYVLPLDSISDIEGVQEQGMIGYETFSRFVTRVDYGARTVTLIDPKHFDPKDAGVAVPFEFNGHNPQIKGAFEGIPGKFDIDTGSRSELTVNKPFAEHNNLRASHPKGKDMVEGWGIGGPSRGYVTRGASLTIGGVEVKNIVTTFTTQTKGAFAGDDYQGNIGSGILKRFVVTFDYEHRVLYLKPLSAPPADIGTFDRAGMWFNVSGDGFKVVDVTAEGPAAAAGILAGDHIATVDGRPAGAIAIYDLRKRLRNEAAGAVVRFGVVRAGVVEVKTVTLRDLI